MELDRYEKYLRSRVRNGELADGTMKKYLAALRRFREWRSGDGEVSVSEFQDYLMDRASRAGSTLNVEKSAFVKYLVVEDRSVDIMPLKQWFRERFDVSSGGTPDFLDEDEFEAVRDAAAEDERDLAMVTLFIRTGMRVGELVALDRDDVVFEPPTEHRGDNDFVADHPDEAGNVGGFVRVKRTKRKNEVTDRRLLYEEDVAAIKDYVQNIEQYAAEAAVDADALFVNDTVNQTAPYKGEYRVRESYVRDHITDIGDRASHEEVDGARLHPHLFRHTVGSWLGMQGYTADEIGDYLGKESSAERYTHFDAQKHSEMSGVLSQMGG